MSAAPAASGRRVAWAAVPDGVRRGVERALGGTVEEAVDQPGGFSPGAAARLRLRGGRRAFAKAVDGVAYPDSAALHRTEARVTASLPPAAPAPRLLAALEDDGWVVLVLTDVEGVQPDLPWRPPQLNRVLEGIGELSAALTPAPAGAEPAAVALADAFDCWGQAAAGDDRALVARLPDWARRNLGQLLALEERWRDAVTGDTLLHGDLRADNVLLTQGGVVFVDWPSACVGAAWADVLLMLPSVAMQGGPPCAQVFARAPSARSAADDDIDAVLAAFAGYLTWRSLRPPPPGLPTVRAFQAAQGAHALAWLRERTGWA